MADRLRGIAQELKATAARLDTLRRKRYQKKWTQREVIVDVLKLSPTPLTCKQITKEMERCGYEFRTCDPSKSVGVNLSKLQNTGRVVKATDEEPGRDGWPATWEAATGQDGDE